MSDADIQIPVQSVEEARTLLGPLDSNARLIRELHGVSVLVRDGSLRLLGEPAHVTSVQHVLEDSLHALRSGRKVSTQEIADRLRAGASDDTTSDNGTAAADGPRTQRAPQAAVRPRTEGQQRYLRQMEEYGDNWVFGIKGQF